MRNFEYVSKKKTKPIKKELIELINLVQDAVREYFTFRYDFIGSESRNMVTYDPTSNIGFDFDVNLMVNDENEEYSAKELKTILMKGFNRYNHLFSYDYCEDSKRVITIKVKDRANSKILHSCDFAIVYDCGDGRQQYIRYNKSNQSYSWEYQPKGFYQLNEKIEWCKKNRLWQEVRDLYLDKKRHNIDLNKKSRSIFAETVNEICTQNGYE